MYVPKVAGRSRFYYALIDRPYTKTSIYVKFKGGLTRLTAP